MNASETTPTTPKNATSGSVATPESVTSAASTIAEKDKESTERIDSTVADKMTAFSRSLADIQPTGLTPAESKQEAEQRGKLSIAVEMFIRCDLQLKAAGRKREHARFELGEQLAGFRLFYKPDRVWGAVKNKLAEGLGFRSSKSIDRIIDNYESQKQITKAERVVAGRLDIPVTPALVKELVAMQLRDGICKTERDAYKRVKLASEEVEQKAEKMAAADPLLESFVKAAIKYLKTIAPDERAERLAEIAESVSAQLESELEEGESQDESAAALGETQRYMRAHTASAWDKDFYQYANRLAVLYFLNVQISIPTRMVFVYIYGDCFPDGRECPASPSEWDELIRSCDVLLGLTEGYPLSERVHDIFLPALGSRAAALL